MISRQFKNKPKFYIHIFPSTEFDWDSLKLDSEKKMLYVRHLFDFHSSNQAQEVPKFWCFKTDGIFLNSCPSEVYETVSCQIFDEICSGVDNVIMSYGQNYSGKTFTLSGLENPFDLRGIIPRFVTDLFGHKRIKEDNISTQVWMSFVDIDGSHIHNLLSTPVKKCKSTKEVEMVKITSELHCFQLLFKGEGNRMNIGKMSYRSHVRSNVVTFSIKLSTLNYHETQDKFSKVHFVDLAGVETIGRNPLTSFKDLKTQSNSNTTKSLMEVLALSFQKQKICRSSVSQRIHKLTEFLGNSFSPRSYIKLICHIRPHSQDIMITLSALKFGMTFKNITMLKPEIHIEFSNDRVIESLRNQVKALQDELMIRDLGSLISPLKISQDRICFVRRAVESYLKNELPENELYSMVGDCGMILNVIRSIEKERLSKERKDIFSQTDEIEYERKLIESSIYKGTSISSPRQSVFKGNTVSTPSTKHVSFSTKSKKKDKGKKPKKDGSAISKGKAKIVLVSEEVQVNLTEPDATLPQIDTRECMWAQFMITHPEIEHELYILQYIVNEKQKKLTKAAAKLDDLDSTLGKVKLSVLQLKTDEALINKKASHEEKMLVSEEKTYLSNELETIQQEMELCQQELTDAKIEWLESMENLSKAKQTAEGVFSKFCKINNLLPLYSEDLSRNESDIVEIKSTLEMEHSDPLKEYFTKLQKKYLHKNFI